MISVSEAKKIINESVQLLEQITIDLYDATGFVLAEDIYSKVDVPLFNQAAMDGYGFRFKDLKADLTLKIDGEIPAGIFPTSKLLPNTAVRIYTGAPIPVDCDTIVVQENVVVLQNKIVINDSLLKKGMNIRNKGACIEKGDLIVNALTKISPALAGYLASIGVEKVKVFRKPKICIITTGKELNKPGQELGSAKVFECNSYSLNAAIHKFDIKPHKLSLDDDEAVLLDYFKNNVKNFDVIIFSGGISVGNYDFVYDILDKCSVQHLFYKVKQKPGKPMYFGKLNNTLIFGLPGNPAATLTCYYEYVEPAIEKMIGTKMRSKESEYLPLSKAFNKKSGLVYFLAAQTVGNEVQIIESQESYQMKTLASADCIVELDESETECKKGTLVKLYMLN